jgi:hypothetical protein
LEVRYGERGHYKSSGSRGPHEEAAQRLTGGNKTEAVALAMRRLLEQNARAGSLFGAHRGSVRIQEGVDIVAPALDVEPDAETGREVER